MTLGRLCWFFLYRTCEQGWVVAPLQQTQISDKMKWMSAYFVTSHFWLIVQGFDLLPVQNNLRVWCVPHHFTRWLTGRCKEQNTLVSSKKTLSSKELDFEGVLAWFFGGHVDSGAGWSCPSSVIRPHWDVICGAAFEPEDNSRRLISYGSLHTRNVFPFTSTPVPQLKSNKTEPQKWAQKTWQTP